MTKLKKGARIAGADRDQLTSELRTKYESGTAIRDLAESIGRSYGFVHRVLAESGVTLRTRGGARSQNAAKTRKTAKGGKEG